jgi:hypothetical protein
MCGNFRDRDNGLLLDNGCADNQSQGQTVFDQLAKPVTSDHRPEAVDFYVALEAF